MNNNRRHIQPQYAVYTAYRFSHRAVRPPKHRLLRFARRDVSARSATTRQSLPLFVFARSACDEAISLRNNHDFNRF